MARFRYRMQNILELDEKLEDQQKAAFSLANARLAEEQQRLQELMMKKASYERQISDHTLGVIEIVEINKIKNAIKGMEFAIRDQMTVIRNAQRAVDDERRKLNAAMQETKTQVKLKEKAFEVFLKEVAAEETMATDELISYKYGNNPDKEE